MNINEYKDLITRLRYNANNTISKSITEDFTNAVNAIEDLIKFIETEVETKKENDHDTK